MPSYNLITTVSTTFTRIKQSVLFAFLKQESDKYLLLESGGKIIIGDNSPTNIAKPSTTYNSISKPV